MNNERKIANSNYFAGHQAGIMSDDWAVSSRPGTWDIQFDWEGAALQTEDIAFYLANKFNFQQNQENNIIVIYPHQRYRMRRQKLNNFCWLLFPSLLL